MIVDQIEPILGEVVIVSYDGEFHPENRTFHGQATALLDNECKYEGTFRNGMFHGKGVFQWPAGIKFEGDLEKGQINGKGVYEWSDGSTYQGDVKNGLRHGTGKFVGSSGQMYEGEWAFGKRHGKGKAWYNEERTSYYTGDWVANLRHGYGSMKYASGNSYEGEWRDDKKCGSGLMVWRDVDEMYSGLWANDLPHGLGEHIWGDSASHSVKKESCNIYRGSFVEGRREGRGCFFYMNGSQYDGDWLGNAKHGEGLFLYADGRIFGGNFQHNRMLTEFSKEEAAAPRATEAVNPQFRLHVGDLFDSFPALLQASAPARGPGSGPSSAINIASVPAKDSASSIADKQQREVKEMERLLLKYNHYLRGALRRYTDFANKRRLREALQQHQLLSAWAPTDVPGRAHKACATARIFQKRLFCMNLEQMLRFLRELGLVGPYFRSYDLSQCFLQMRDEVKVACAGKLREYNANMRAAQRAARKAAAGQVQEASAEGKTEEVGAWEEEGESEEEFVRLLTLQITSMMDPYLHPNARDPAFHTLACQPLFEREFVELFVRAVAVRYGRAKGLGAQHSAEAAAVAGMSLTQILYYVLAQKLLPLVTDFEESTPSFYREFYYEEVQTLLLSNEVIATHGAPAGDAQAPAPAAGAATSGRSPTHKDAAGAGEDGASTSASSRDGHIAAGTSEPTSLEKLWAHLKALAGSGAVREEEEPTRVCGAALPAMHSAGPPALRCNRTGGNVRLSVLLDYLLSLWGSALSADATQLGLMVALECAVPSAGSVANAPPVQPPAPAPPAGSEKEGGDAPAPSADPASPLPQASDYDLSCVESRIDFQDFLELLCRVISSPFWTFAGATPASLLPPAAVQGGAEDQDSASVYSVNLADILAERIAAWKQGFDFDHLTA